MREHKPGDSRCDFPRDVYPVRGNHGLTVPMIQHAQAVKLTELNDRSVRLGGAAVSLQDPRDIAKHVAHLADGLRFQVLWGTGAPHDLADALAAQVIALRLALARSEAGRIDTGDAA